METDTGQKSRWPKSPAGVKVPSSNINTMETWEQWTQKWWPGATKGLTKERESLFHEKEASVVSLLGLFLENHILLSQNQLW